MRYRSINDYQNKRSLLPFPDRRPHPRASDNHIGTVIADPERFGLTKEEIETAYDRHEETDRD